MRNQFLLGAAVAALVIPAAAAAQETTSAIRGTVTAGGAPVAGATVVATDVASGTRSQTSTDGSGSFSLSGLRVGGPYTVEITSAQGNKTVTDIFTVVQQQYTLPVELADAAADGAAGPDIVVTAASIQGAGVTSDGPQTVITQLEIGKVASVNRDVRDIVRRDPFATLDLTNQGERGGAISIAGVNPRFNRFTINGVQVGDNFGLNQDASPTNRGPVPFDALAQVSVSVAPYDFRQGGFQGGAIDTVLLSGNNEFHGTGFYSQSRDELQGKRSQGNTYIIPDYKSETYGATLRGPIIADTLFFMVSAERNTDPRPFATQASQIPGLTGAQISAVTGISTGTYRYDPGPALTINNRLDEKIVGRIDWNVTQGQRLSLSYINAFDSLDSQNNTSASNTSPSYGLTSNAYALSELLRAGIVQLNSDWTDDFSTEARGIYKWYRRGQEPLLGRGFAQFRVCTDAATVGSLTACNAGGGGVTASPIIAFGPDNSRQTNELFFDTWAGSLLARYRQNNHELKFLAEYEENRTFNNFLQNSLGNYYFDSVADFQNRQATQLIVAVPLNGEPDGAAADFKYSKWTFGIQDDWRVSDTLNVSFGFRWDLYGMRSTPALNPFFLAREGFRNTKTYKGLEIFQPRISFNWEPLEGLRLRGGGGIFGGGSPDIFLSNSFSNTILSNTVTITRAAAASAAGQGTQATCTTALATLPANVCNAALNGVTGQIPATVSDYVRSAASASLTNTGALDPDFRLPSSYKLTLSADYELFGVDIGADYYFSAAKDQITFTDSRTVAIGVLPDGRPRYNQILGNFADNNYDILTTNTGKGRTHIGVVRADKRFDFGLSLNASYTLQDVRDVSGATSSTINSNYQNQTFVDPNNAALGTSLDQIKWQFKYGVGFDKALFGGDYRTRIQLFGETRAGRPYSFTMLNNVGNNRSPVFGTILTPGQQLLYVPTTGADTRVSYDSAATQTALEGLIAATDLKKYRGQIAPKNIARAASFTRLDLHVEQELPTGIGGSKVSVFADVNNLLNFIDKDWGALKQFGFPYAASVVQVTCLQSPVLTGTAPGTTPATGAVTTTTAQPCAQYRYSNYVAPNERVTNVTASLYAIRVGARFTF